MFLLNLLDDFPVPANAPQIAPNNKNQNYIFWTNEACPAKQNTYGPAAPPHGPQCLKTQCFMRLPARAFSQRPLHLTTPHDASRRLTYIASFAHTKTSQPASQPVSQPDQLSSTPRQPHRGRTTMPRRLAQQSLCRKCFASRGVGRAASRQQPSRPRTLP